MFLRKPQIEALMARGEDPLIVRPLLEVSQIGEISLDLRLGCDFLVSIQGRASSINASLNYPSLPVQASFQPTRRQLGESFLLHPHQTILGVSLEYLKVPTDILVELNMRSSYARLGLTVSTIVQPGYCGCFPLELTNVNNNAINLTIGARIIQARFFRTEAPTDYFHSRRKYVCQVRPEVSSALRDKDLEVLNRIWKTDNHRPP